MRALLPGMKTYCIDIDGVIAAKNGTCKTCKYEASTPMRENIEKINKLYDEGHYIKYVLLEVWEPIMMMQLSLMLVGGANRTSTKDLEL